MTFKVKKNKNFTIMSNYHLRDKNLSLKAKGLLSFMLSLPDDWDYSINGLIKINRESEKVIRNILKELKEQDYLIIEKIRDEKGRYRYNYLIYEEPFSLGTKKEKYPESHYPHMDSPGVDNQPQINTKEQIDKIDKSNLIKKHNHFITKFLIRSGYIEEDELFIYLYNKLFFDLYNSHESKKIISATHYSVSKILEKNFIDENGDIIENKYLYLKKSINSNIEKLESFNVLDNKIDWLSDICIDDFEL